MQGFPAAKRKAMTEPEVNPKAPRLPGAQRLAEEKTTPPLPRYDRF